MAGDQSIGTQTEGIQTSTTGSQTSTVQKIARAMPQASVASAVKTIGGTLQYHSCTAYGSMHACDVQRPRGASAGAPRGGTDRAQCVLRVPTTLLNRVSERALTGNNAVYAAREH